jgi:S1-C subfamily serine protease
MVRSVVASARDGSRTVRRPWLGARLQNVTPDIAETMGMERPTGVLVAATMDRSPAADAGLKRGDVILSVDGQEVDNPEAFGYRFSLKGISGETNLTIMRAGARNTVPVRLSTPPETRPREPTKIRSRSPLAGATLVNSSPAVADELQLDISGDGAVIWEIDSGSVAQRVGFQKGDMVMAINGDRTSSSREVEKIVRAGAQVWEITISRGGRVFTTVLGG